MKTRLLIPVVLISLLFLWATQFVAHGQPGKALADLEFSTFFLPFESNVEGAVVAIDGNGGIHAAYSPASGNRAGKYLAYYAYCASDCAKAESWKAIAVGEVGFFGGHVRLALDPQGAPRLLWYRQRAVGERGMYVYAACTQNCLSATNWQVVDITPANSSPEQSRYFALDPQGRPRFFYVDTQEGHTGTFYRSCDSNCLVASSWQEGQFSEAYNFSDFSLAFDSAGHPRLAYAYGYNDAQGEWQRAVGYAACDSACGSGSTWTSGLLFRLGVDAAFSLRLDAGGQPHLALFPGYLGEETTDYLLYYAWCDGDCTGSDNWLGYRVAVPQRYGYEVELLLDEQQLPHLAYAIDDITDSTYGLGYSRCTAGCESGTATWETLIVETVDEVQAESPVPPEQGCSISVWMPVGRAPSLALDSEGKPYIAYDAEHAQGGTCAIHTDIQLVRFAASGSGGGTREYLLYLPLLRKP